MSIIKEPFGTSSHGEDIFLYTITNRNNSVLKVTNMGAVWVSMIVRDKKGNFDDVVLGLESGEEYEFRNNDAFGATVGRSANRIGGAKFMLNGETFELTDNDGGNNLHSGPLAYHTRVFAAEEISDEEGEGVEFSLVSRDGDQGMPGTLDFSVSYVLKDDDSVVIEYNGITDKDTVVNLTNHSYFNLGGHKSGSIENEKVWIDADFYTPTDAKGIPTGEILSVEGTLLDFRTLRSLSTGVNSDNPVIAERGGYDHNFVLKTNGDTVEYVARAVDEATGRVMDIYTDLPGIQMYTGNYIGPEGKTKDGAQYTRRCGVAFESQYYPNAINTPHFPSPVVKAGEKFNTCTIYKFSVTED